jgi:hypothetical protein
MTILTSKGSSDSRQFIVEEPSPVMDTRNMSDARVTIKSAMNSHTVEEQPLPDLDSPQLQGHPRRLVRDQGGAPSSAVSRLLPIEGLRAYLALWVVVCHALWASGYEMEALTETCPS